MPPDDTICNGAVAVDRLTALLFGACGTPVNCGRAVSRLRRGFLQLFFFERLSYC
jgi:hypothetical protein